jgi:anti-sigma factor RsiW
MSCTLWNDNLTARLYGELPADEDAALDAHLATCLGCRETLEEFRRVRSLLREDEGETPRMPRVVVLRDRSRFRPALLAASLLGAAIVAGVGAGAGYALGLGRARPTAVAATTSPAPGVATEELVRREVDRRIAALQGSRAIETSSKQAASGGVAGERGVSSPELRAELAKFERRLNGSRAADLDYVLDQIAASEVRIGARLGQTNQALRSVALASNPRVNEQ